MIEHCYTCGDKIPGNIPLELGIITTLGYKKYKFCKDNCFLDFVIKEFKRKLKRKLAP